MAQIGEIYHYYTQPKLRLQIVEILEDKSSNGYLQARAVTIGTHSLDGWPIGIINIWTMDSSMILETPLASSCSCYWSKHPLFCKCSNK